MLSSEKLEKLICDVFAPKKGEIINMLCDLPKNDSSHDKDYLERYEMNKIWHQSFRKLGNQIGFSVEELIFFEPTGAHGGPLPKYARQGKKKIHLHNKMKSWGNNHLIIGITRFSATGPIFGLVPSQNFRASTMPGANMQMSAFLADYKIVARKAKTLAKELTWADHAIVEFSTKDKCYFDLRTKRHGHADDGCCQLPGHKINLPSGEAYVAPYEGKDKKLGPSQTEGIIPAKFGKEVVKFKIEAGKIKKVLGGGKNAKRLNKFFAVDSARRYIAEFGLGCNDAATLCGEILQDEKIEGFHWAYGYNAYLGGAIDKSAFKSEKNLVHQDTIYSADSPIKISKITLERKKEKRIIMTNNKYSKKLGKVFE